MEDGHRNSGLNTIYSRLKDSLLSTYSSYHRPRPQSLLKQSDFQAPNSSSADVEIDIGAAEEPPVLVTEDGSTTGDQTEASETVTARQERSRGNLWSPIQAIWNSFMNWLKSLRLVLWSKRVLANWKAGVKCAIFVAVVILTLNIIFLIWAATRPKYSSDGLWVLFEGDCTKANSINIAGHLLINVLSTLLLGLSNYCMQLLASPTRADVDKAHKRRDWVDIGTQSFRNCWKRHVSVTRTSLWLLLAISSTPLHLLWNSAIIFSPVAYEYYQITVSENFVAGMKFDDSIQQDIQGYDTGTDLFGDNLHFLQEAVQQPNTYEKLDNLACQRTYAQDFMQDRSDVIVIVESQASENGTAIVYGVTGAGRGPWPYAWLCPSGSAASFNCLGDLFHDTEEWKFQVFNNSLVKYCLSKQVDQTCKLEYAYTAGVIVVVANLIKLLCFIWVYFLLRKHAGDESSKQQLLITTGDAIASFLADPDPYTFDMSLVAKSDFENGLWKLRFFQIASIPWIDRGSYSIFRVIGRRRWFIGHIFAILMWTIPLGFLCTNANYYQKVLGISWEVLRQLGFGKPNARFLFQSWTQNNQEPNDRVLQNTVLANMPQLLISLAYFFYNQHFTCMAAATEYATFANSDPSKRRGLRVSNPKANTRQRSTYFLSLPLKHWLLLSSISTLLNWLASQAIFFARVITLDHWLQPTSWSISHVGYSIPSLMCFTIVAFLASFVILTFGLRRLKTNMPLASTCSAALSAACHPADTRFRDAATGKWKVRMPPEFDHCEENVSWGVEVGEGGVPGLSTEEYCGYCTFSSREVIPPREGWILG